MPEESRLLGFVFILFKLKEGTPPYPRAAGPRHGGMLEESQDKRIRKLKFERGQERKLKMKGK